MKTPIILLLVAGVFNPLYAENEPPSIRSIPIKDERTNQAMDRVHKYAGTDLQEKLLVFGEVNQPGIYKPPALTLESAVKAAGGWTRLASRTHYYILSAGVLTEYYLPRDSAGLPVIDLQSGDALFIESECTAFGSSVFSPAKTEP